MEPIQKFRGTAFGGFNRQDVLEYIEKSAQENQARIESLTAELEAAQEEKNALAATLDSLRNERGGEAEQEAKMRASLEESNRNLATARGELQTARMQVAASQKELTELQKKIAHLEPLAQRYEALKDRIATVELDAHQKAQEIVKQAEMEAESVREGISRWLDEFKSSYGKLRAQVRNCAEIAAQTEEAFSATDGEYEALMSWGRGEREVYGGERTEAKEESEELEELE